VANRRLGRYRNMWTIILKWILKKQDARVWTEFSWLIVEYFRVPLKA